MLSRLHSSTGSKFGANGQDDEARNGCPKRQNVLRKIRLKAHVDSGLAGVNVEDAEHGFQKRFAERPTHAVEDADRGTEIHRDGEGAHVESTLRSVLAGLAIYVSEQGHG